jgi:hypothetical protein
MLLAPCPPRAPVTVIAVRRTETPFESVQVCTIVCTVLCTVASIVSRARERVALYANGALIGSVGTPLGQAPIYVAVAAGTPPPQRSDDGSVVELPNHPPVLTPGLARALGRVIVKASRAAECTEVCATDGPEVLAS